MIAEEFLSFGTHHFYFLPMAERKEVEAQFLKVDDYLPNIACTVIREPERGLYTESGKVDLVVRNKRGMEIQKQWNARTKIIVLTK